ncbi:MAG: tetratricopeptide repeat protein [Alphaproteobacteria bacterium]|nr:tetratricopeptide repeat protein [Alphaproteobacteria bacterium]
MEHRPSFSAIEHHIALARGLDLDDDAQELTRCEALGEDDQLTDVGWQYLGVLRWRAGRFAEAAAAFERAASGEDGGVKDRLFAAYSHLRAGAPEVALAGFDALLDDADDEASPAAVHRARGDALWTLGRLQDAEAAYMQSATEDPDRAGIWTELARLQETLGDLPAALKAVDLSLKRNDGDTDVKFLKAALLALHGEADAAVTLLEEAISWSDEHKAAARVDPRFEALRGDARFEALTAPPPAPDLSWIDGWPGLAALRDSPALQDLRFVDRAEADKGGADIREHYAGNWHLGFLWSPALWEGCQARVANLTMLAECPSVWHRNGFDVHGVLFVDLDQPEQLWFAPSTSMPATLWTPVAASAEAVRAVLDTIYPARRVPVGDLPLRRRAFMGYLEHMAVPNPYSGTMVQADFHELDRYFVFSPVLDAHLWGSAFPDDPWPDRIPPQPGWGIKIGAQSRKVRRQLEDGVCRFTRRALFSRAQVSYELHRGRFYVWEVRYRPNPHPEVIEQLNALLGTTFPTDLPADVVGAILGFDWAEADDLEVALDAQTEPGTVMAYLDVIAALRHDDAGMIERLRPLIDDPALNLGIANICLAYNWESLLEDIGLTLPPGDARDQVTQILAQGIAPPQYDELGEPVGFWESDE